MSDAADDLDAALTRARRALLDERCEAGHWVGELSTSALSTATALVALGCVDEAAHRARIDAATAWLVGHQNGDGGWGDTVKSFSNVSTTLLAWSALSRFGGGQGQEPEQGQRQEGDAAEAVRRAEYWIRDYVGSISPERIAETVKARYGKDRTFSVPILMLCAICGTLGPRGWRWVLRLPFELAALPRHWFAALRLPVVSYALPALIAIGYARHRRGWAGRLPAVHPFWPRVSRLLAAIQPTSGGFLEAAPLTSFVAMALASAGQRDHPVVERGVAFLLDTVRSDGSWPIDTNLATWTTTLSVKALEPASGGDGGGWGPGRQGWVDESTRLNCREAVRDWLLGQQYREVHPYTDSPPGGWAWTDLSGGVPDADDTPGALLALDRLGMEGREAELVAAAEAGIDWLLGLQNRDGGIPTFCRGWGALPFDRSSPDLTAHALRAWNAWRDRVGGDRRARIDCARGGAVRFLRRHQRADGSWSPLWFGNQHRSADEENPTYGTAAVVRALDEVGESRLADAGAAWLLRQQGADGGWGGGGDGTPASTEETALAVAALAERAEAAEAVAGGVAWLVRATDGGRRFEPAPIGFYFAKLWYFERLYPIAWTVEALTRVAAARAN